MQTIAFGRLTCPCVCVCVCVCSIEVEVDVRDHVATVLASLHYENKEDSAIEAVFVFPLPAEAAVCHFAAKIGQSEIVAEAREEYDDALSSGRQAFLLEESEQSPDIFSLSVGSLPPGESASIRLEYVTELAVEADDGLRFCLPVVLNPRYHPQADEGTPRVTSVVASGAPYALSFSARVSSPRQVTKVDSECCLEPLRYLDKEQTSALVRLAAGHQFDRDVELLIYYKDAHRPAAVVEAGKASAEPGTLMGDAVVMVSLYPEFPPAAATSSLATRGEFVFLLDRSGSMDCPMDECHRSVSRISSARDTLLLLLKSLPMGCYFNIYSFGSSFQHVFPQSVEYGEATLVDALKKVEQMGADLGGTEILQPLKHIYGQPPIPAQPRQLFVFTDGEVGNTKEVTRLVKQHSASHRCFSFGIGEGASTALINGLAKEGGGHAQFITGGAQRMRAKVCRCEERKGRGASARDKAVELSVQSGVSSSYTAFVAVRQGDGAALGGPLLRRNIPAPCCKCLSQEPVFNLNCAAFLSVEEVWATILALVWLHGLQSEARDEWQLLALKAAAWLRAQKGRVPQKQRTFWTPNSSQSAMSPDGAFIFPFSARSARVRGSRQRFVGVSRAERHAGHLSSSSNGRRPPRRKHPTCSPASLRCVFKISHRRWLAPPSHSIGRLHLTCQNGAFGIKVPFPVPIAQIDFYTRDTPHAPLFFVSFPRTALLHLLRILFLAMELLLILVG
uniref:VIT domain-containing protein n=1 Tax=Hippocampus comes TaxID=109280 RepID=A0A3Q2Z8V6_HIPCM